MSAKNEFSTPAGRLAYVLRYSGLPSLNALALHLGLKRSENLYQIKKGNHSISRELAERIQKAYPDLTISWLLTGEGAAEKGQALPPIADTIRKVAFYDRLPESFPPPPTLPQRYMSLPESVLQGAGMAVVYHGGELFPRIESGSLLLLKEQEQADEPLWGQVHLVVTDRMRVFRIVRPWEDRAYVRLTTFFPERYGDLVIRREAIRHLYRVSGSITHFDL